MSTVPQPNPSQAPSTGVDSDIPCRTCGYNLRSLPTDGLCPECGTRVDHSLRGDWLPFADPQWLRKLGNGTALMVLGCRTSLIVCTLLIAYRGRPQRLFSDPKYIGSGFRPLFSSIYFGLGAALAVGLTTVGVWLATTADPGEVDDDSANQLRRIIRIMCLIYAIDTLIQVAASKVAVPPDAALALRVIDHTADLINVVGFSAQLHYFRNLARRIPDVFQAARANTLKWILPAAYTVWITVTTVEWEFPSPAIPRHVLSTLADVARLAGLVYIAAWLAYVALVGRMRRQFRREAAIAEQNRAMRDRADAQPASAPPSQI